MENPWLRRYAVLVAVCTALLIITGPAVSSNEVRPLYSLGQSHAWLGATVTTLMAGLVIWLTRLKERVGLRRLAYAALGANIVQDLLGFDPVPAPMRISHALLGFFFFSTTVAIAVFVSKGWMQNPKPVENGSLPRFLVMTIPSLVLFQVTLGVAFRHGVMSGLPHILGALVVAAFLGPAMALILRNQHTEVRSAGIALTLCASLQILLGFTLLIILAMDPLVVIVATTAHAAMGAFTLAAAAVVAMRMRRVIWAGAARETEESPSSFSPD
jgi:heme A synthase